MDRVADFESVGWGFESLVPRHKKYTPEGVYFYVKKTRDENPKELLIYQKLIILLRIPTFSTIPKAIIFAATEEPP